MSGNDGMRDVNVEMRGSGDEDKLDRKQELRLKWKEQKTVAGVFQIKNMKNHKAFVDSTRNITTVNGQKFRLEHHSHPNQSLQKEWDEFGEEAFSFDVLEVLEKDPDEYYDLKNVLKKLKEKWIEQLQPFAVRL